MGQILTLLTRDQFREGVLKRDNYKCLFCNSPAKDAHHIIERRLFSDGGYYLDNGASLCELHHLEAEKTLLSAAEIRQKLKVTTPVLPDHFYPDVEYDKWGNIIISNTTRIRGELFNDPSVQKILSQANLLSQFSPYYKYPRTYHLPHSSLQQSDRQLPDDGQFIGQEVVVTLKMDGENTTMYRDHIHARSIDSGPHQTRDWVKTLWAKTGYLLDQNMRVCGENLYAVHSIKYTNLSTYFLAFSIWIEDRCLSWDETLEYLEILDLQPVPTIYRGIYNPQEIRKQFQPYEEYHEGYVIRTAGEFSYSQFRKHVAKFVQPTFRQAVNNSHGHWMSKVPEINLLKNET